MMKAVSKFIDSYYNERVEDFCVRLLYFFNTIDTYYLIAGGGSYLLYVFFNGGTPYPLTLVLLTVAVWVGFKIADFFPLFVLFGTAGLYFLFQSPDLGVHQALVLLGLNGAAFVLIQFGLMGIPDSIVARDPWVSIRKIWNSIFTVAPTTVSLSMSVFFSTMFSFVLLAQPSPLETPGQVFWLIFFGGALVTRLLLPKPFASETCKPEHNGPLADRVIVLNIDGCRLDKAKEAELPYLSRLENESTYFPNGLQTVYRALTNPAFASILTGVNPRVHGIKDNNLGQVIKVEGLPDLVETKLYGSMHVKHFSKPEWDTAIVSLPMLGVGKSDDHMFDLIKDDLLKKDGQRLLIADISEVDFLGHAYGSESKRYLAAMRRADQQIEDFVTWLADKNLMEDTVIIICSDHGMKVIDHSYLLFDAEKYVPFFIFGKNIKKGNPLEFDASILDIAPTICYILGIPYPSHSEGRVIVEAIAD